MHMRNKFGPAAFFVATAFCAVQAIAQSAYPSRPIRFIVPFPPGGGAEATALVTADFQRFGRSAREIGLRTDQ